MALSLVLCALQNVDCSSVSMKDITGVYSAGNVGGWGAPNKTIADANFATISVSKRNSDGTYGTEFTIDAYPTLPNITGVLFTFTSTLLGIGTKFTDGIYKIAYTVGNNAVSNWSSSVTIYKVFDCSAKCCYQKISDQVSVCSCGCDDLNEKYAQISTYYRLLQGAKQDGSLDAIQAYLDKLSRLCISCNCSC